MMINKINKNQLVSLGLGLVVALVIYQLFEPSYVTVDKNDYNDSSREESCFNCFQL